MVTLTFFSLEEIEHRHADNGMNMQLNRTIIHRYTDIIPIKSEAHR